MDIELNKRILYEAMDMAANMGETLDAFIQRAICNQLYIDSVVLEKVITETEEMHNYPIGRASGSTLIGVLADKGIAAESFKDEDKNYYLKTRISPEDFKYLKSIQANHHLSLRLPCHYEDYPSEKTRELCRMYPDPSFSYPEI